MSASYAVHLALLFQFLGYMAILSDTGMMQLIAHSSSVKWELMIFKREM